MQNESRFIVIKRDGERVKFLRHEGHKQYWSTDRTDAMEYTRIEVAQGLAEQHGGTLQAL